MIISLHSQWPSSAFGYKAYTVEQIVLHTTPARFSKRSLFGESLKMCNRVHYNTFVHIISEFHFLKLVNYSCVL